MQTFDSVREIAGTLLPDRYATTGSQQLNVVVTVG